MVNVFILADDTERIRQIRDACGLHDEDVRIHVAEVGHFDPSIETPVTNCDIVIIDHANPVDRCIGLVDAIRQSHPASRILVTGIPGADDRDRTDLIFAYLEYGAAGYIGAGALGELPVAIEELLRGGAWIEPEITSELVQRTVALREALATIKPHTWGTGQPEVLTRRQSEVLELLAAGLSNRQIAEELYISIGTVKNHVHRILDVLQASSRQQAAEFYQYLQTPAAAA